MKKLAGIFAALVLAFPVFANQPQQPAQQPEAGAAAQPDGQGVIKQKQTYEESKEEKKD